MNHLIDAKNNCTNKIASYDEETHTLSIANRLNGILSVEYLISNISTLNMMNFDIIPGCAPKSHSSAKLVINQLNGGYHV